MICEVSGRDCPTLDEHHVIPREYGGITGPTVRIDPALHQAIHRYASNSAKLDTFLIKYPVSVRERIRMLVLAIKEAEKSLEKVKNRSITITFTEGEYEKLERLAAGLDKTVQQVVKTMVKNLLSYGR